MMKQAREQIRELGEVYTELLGLAREKTEALKGNDYEKLAEISEKEQSAIDRAKAVEEARMKTITAIAEKWGVAEELVTAQALIARADAQESAPLREAVQSLSQTLRALRAQNEINGRLLGIKMKLASFILDVSRSDFGDPGNYYNNDGTEQQKDELTHPRFIDSEI